MTHDPMCRDQSYDVPGFGRCECDLIARVRADERERAAERVESLGVGLGGRWGEGWNAARAAAIAAARGGDA